MDDRCFKGSLACADKTNTGKPESRQILCFKHYYH